jgi:hypothetical protein
MRYLLERHRIGLQFSDILETTRLNDMPLKSSEDKFLVQPFTPTIGTELIKPN